MYAFNSIMKLFSKHKPKIWWIVVIMTFIMCIMGTLKLANVDTGIEGTYEVYALMSSSTLLMYLLFTYMETLDGKDPSVPSVPSVPTVPLVDPVSTFALTDNQPN